MHEFVNNIFRRLSGQWLLTAGLAAAVFMALWMLRTLTRGRRRGRVVLPPDLEIDVAALTDAGPPPEPPVLEFYHLPVRLAAIVLAPLGRASELPSREELPEAIDSILPGLDRVVAAHQPLIRAWPAQMSVRGFAHAFFCHARLPGDRGVKTPWSSVAGRFTFDDKPMMAGLILRSESPNRHGQYVVMEEEQWLGMMRIRLEGKG
jgi:hypothetical protein